MHFAVVCRDVEDSTERRRTALADHRRYVDARSASILASGPLLADGSEERVGQLFLLDVADRAAVEAFVADDPLTHAGVFAEVSITRIELKFQSGARF
ncbi:MAG: YciI family protein [Acidimicrobiales bacterium]